MLHKVSHDIDALGDFALEWPGLKTLGYAISFRQEGNEPSTEASIRYYISSAVLSAEDFAHSIREH